ncbi:hemerythrin domain-containing protein [Brevibacillus marinus]|uniref:hemerythrin domain-containing protein n=1 Tax=Brevibacillus marinus TaxID=2496837 RepID=UPI001F493AF5|nr:hemerythrin domain-containing protein [Brevibacillus marinus]
MKAASEREKLDLSDWQPVQQAEYGQLLSIIAPELHSFIEEHSALSGLMDRVRESYDEAVYAEALQVIGSELDQHFTYEEELLLPRLAKRIGSEQVGPIYKLRQDHQVIRNRYAEVRALFAERSQSTAREALVQRMNLLAYLLKKHIEKEDHYLFPLLSLILTAAEKADIAHELHARHERR